jgi:predicted RNase H-like HicB family nuclease
MQGDALEHGVDLLFRQTVPRRDPGRRSTARHSASSSAESTNRTEPSSIRPRIRAGHRPADTVNSQTRIRASSSEDPHMPTRSLTAIIEREDDAWVALCPELDIASQGDTVEQARSNLREAIELFFECADPAEVSARLRSDVFITQVDVAIG